MGVIGGQIGTYGLGALGSYVGKKLGNEQLGKKVGASAGNILGSELIPFKKGGMVKTKGKRKTMVAILHKNELVVPASMVKDVPKILKNKIAKKGRNMKSKY
jgi:hypothetical protein